MKTRFLTTFLISFLLLFIIGCGEEEPQDNKVAVEQTKLILRLFDNMKDDNYQVALTQAKKLLANNKNNGYLINVIEVETINVEFAKINEELANKNLAKAYTIIHALNAKYPLNINVQKTYEKISLLYKLEKDIEQYKKGKLDKLTLDEQFKTVYPMDYRNLEKAIKKTNK